MEKVRCEPNGAVGPGWNPLIKILMVAPALHSCSK